MGQELLIPQGVHAEGVGPHALEAAGNQIFGRLLVRHGEIVVIIGAGAPLPLPAGVEQHEIRRADGPVLLPEVVGGDDAPGRQVRYVQHHGPAAELGGGQHLQRGAPGKHVGRGVHVGTGVGGDGQLGLPEPVPGQGAGGLDGGGGGAGIHGHLRRDGVGQVDNHGRELPFLPCGGAWCFF